MMSAKAIALQGLYRRSKVTIVGLQNAVADGVITAQEYKEITGEEYSA